MIGAPYIDLALPAPETAGFLARFGVLVPEIYQGLNSVGATQCHLPLFLF